MPRIFDFNLQVHDRFATVASIRALKNSDVKLTETSLTGAEDAIVAEAAGIEMGVADASAIADVRKASQRLFLTSAIDFVPNPPVTEDDVLRAAMTSIEQGADAIHTSRRPETIRRLVDEKIPVMCHVGFVPRQSNLIGGIRCVGKTAEEAMRVFDEIRRFEDAGAFAVECELIASEMMGEITRRTGMATISLGSGSDADIMGQFMSDVCGEHEHIPRHARVYADVMSMQQKIREVRTQAMSDFKADVLSGSYPNDGEIVHANDDEVNRFRDMLK